MRARIRITWNPTTSDGLHHHVIDIYGQNGNIVPMQELGISESQYELLVDENQYLNIYVYSMNSQNQGNSAYAGMQIPFYTSPDNPPPVEAVPNAPDNLSVSIIGWEA